MDIHHTLRAHGKSRIWCSLGAERQRFLFARTLQAVQHLKVVVAEYYANHEDPIKRLPLVAK